MSTFDELRELEEQGIDLVEILGQDRPLDSPGALEEIVRRLSKAGGDLYAELLYYLTYRRFEPEEARRLWNGIRKHKRRMEAKLARPVTFRVAALEYLSDRNPVLQGVRLVARPEFERLLAYVHIDEVTLVYNRRYFNERLTEEVQRARRYGSPVSLLLLDLDDFKQVNETDGHLQGDTVLRKVARLLRDTTRQTDKVCRFGGDEFAVILPETNSSEAYTTAQRIRSAVSRLKIPRSSGAEITLTSSIGGATYPADCEDAEELVALADQMCLEAKKAGKNRIRFYAGGRPQPLET